MYDVIPVTSPKNYDCGETCLKMLLAYYGTDIPLEDLIRECNTRMIGSSARDLCCVGKAHGLDIKIFQMDAEELIRQDRPAIIWWKYRHWCVFCGQDEAGKIVICNPDLGRYRMSEALFASFYTGVSLWNGEPHDIVQE